jgi:hypothetical protein
LGEFIGGIAVIASIVYLAIQIRQNTRSVRSSTLATNTANWSSMLVNLSSEGQSDAYLNGMMGKADISAKHLLQFVLIARAMLVSSETQHYQYLNGALDKDIYLGYERACRDQMLAFPGFRMVWEITREQFSPKFRALVDKLASEINDEDSYTIAEKWHQQAQQRSMHHPGSPEHQQSLVFGPGFHSVRPSRTVRVDTNETGHSCVNGSSAELPGFSKGSL